MSFRLTHTFFIFFVINTAESINPKRTRANGMSEAISAGDTSMNVRLSALPYNGCHYPAQWNVIIEDIVPRFQIYANR